MKKLAFTVITAWAVVHTCKSADWWQLDDSEFIKQYKPLAIGNRDEQSRFAWMLFARVNQPKDLNGKTFAEWELWPSNDDTFSPAVRMFSLQNKVRTRPHLQPPKFLRLPEFRAQISGVNPFPNGGEEVTRNQLSYSYIADKKRSLTTRAGVWSVLTSTNKIVDLPVGGIEVKASWEQKAIPGAYQLNDGQVTYSLTGLHIMAKIDKTPSDPFKSPDPSWFWTTFEFTGNLNRSSALKFITYPDSLPVTESAKLMSEAGVSQTFEKYACNGTQIQFVDDQKKPIVLGNTQMEWAFASPRVQDPSKWKSWNSSCHTCHGESSGVPKNQFQVDFFQFKAEIGQIAGLPSTENSIDFVWSIPFHTR